MGFFSRIKKIFGAPSQTEEQAEQKSASEALQEQRSEQQPQQQADQQSELQQKSDIAAPESESSAQQQGAPESQTQEDVQERQASEESGQAVPDQAEFVSAEEAVIEEEKADSLSIEPLIQQEEKACPAAEKSEDADEADRVSEALEGQKAGESAAPAEEEKPEAPLDAWAAFRPLEEAKSAEAEPATVEPAAESEVSVEKSESSEERSEAVEAVEAAEPSAEPEVSVEKSTDERTEAPEAVEAAEPEASAEKSEGTDERAEDTPAQEAVQKVGDKAAEAAEPVKVAIDPWAAFRPAEEAKEASEPEQVTEEIEPAVRSEAGAQKSEGTDEKNESIGAQEAEQKAGDKAAEAVEPVKAAIDPWAAFRPAEEAKEAFEPEQVTEEIEPAVRSEAGAQKSEGTEEKFEAPGAASEAGQEAAAEGQKVLEESAQASSEKPCAEEEGPAPAAVQEQQTAQGPVQEVGQKADEGGEDEIIIDLGAPLMPEDWEENRKKEEEPAAAVADFDYPELTLRLREAEARLSVWLDIVLDGVSEAGDELNRRVTFLLRTLEAPADEAKAFVDDFAGWLERMEYRQIEDFRSELQYRLALALDLEDEEDERSRLFLKLSNSLAKTRAQFARHFEGLISSHGELDDEFWEELEEIFIMADLGVEAAMELTERLRTRAREQKVTTSEGARELLREEIRSIFARPRHIVGITPPEVVLMIGVNGAGKTTTIAKLAYRDRMQGKKVMIAAADTFRAAAIEQLQVWATRVGALFHAKQAGSDPASVAYEAMDRAMSEGVDVLYVDTAGRLQTKVNLMDELAKIRNVIARKHPGAPHRTVLVLDATTGQNALSQAKLFKESAGVDELILTKLDGTAKGGVAIAVAMQHKLPITYVGLGEKVEDLRPFNGDDYAEALLKI